MIMGLLYTGGQTKFRAPACRGKAMTKRKLFSVLGILGVLAAGGMTTALMMSFKAEAARSEPEEEAPARIVRTRKLVPGPQTLGIRAEGFLKSARSLTIHSAVAGRVVETRGGLKGGTVVEEGALLLRLDDRRAALGFEGARDETIRTAMDFIASAGLTGAEREGWDAYTLALTAAGGTRIPNIPPMNARQNLLAVTKGLTEAHRKLETAAISRQDHFITAPFAGILSGDGITEGTLVSAGQKLAVLSENHRLEASFSISADNLKHITLGDRVELSLYGTELTTVSSVARIEPILVSGSQMGRIYVELETESPSDWLPGSYVSALIQGRTIESAYRIPRGSLIGGRIPLYDSGRLLLLPAAVLARDALDSIISADLPPGAELVETVIQNPAPGMALAKEQDS